MKDRYQTTAVNILARLIQELEINGCDISEETTPHRITVTVKPHKMEDYLCLIGKSWRTFRHAKEIISAIANREGKALTWETISRTTWGPEDEKQKEEFMADRTFGFLTDLSQALFGETAEMKAFKVAKGAVWNIEFGHAESQMEQALELKPHLAHIIRLIGLIHNQTFNVSLIPSAFEPEKQPKAADGRFIKEIKR